MDRSGSKKYCCLVIYLPVLQVLFWYESLIKTTLKRATAREQNDNTEGNRSHVLAAGTLKLAGICTNSITNYHQDPTHLETPVNLSPVATPDARPYPLQDVLSERRKHAETCVPDPVAGGF